MKFLFTLGGFTLLQHANAQMFPAGRIECVMEVCFTGPNGVVIEFTFAEAERTMISTSLNRDAGDPDTKKCLDSERFRGSGVDPKLDPTNSIQVKVIPSKADPQGKVESITFNCGKELLEIEKPNYKKITVTPETRPLEGNFGLNLEIFTCDENDHECQKQHIQDI